MKVWLVTEFIALSDYDGEHHLFEITGVFNSKKAAIDACKTWRRGYAEFNINEIQPEKPTLLDTKYPIKKED